MRLAPAEWRGIGCRFNVAEAAASSAFLPFSGSPPACDPTRTPGLQHAEHPGVSLAHRLDEVRVGSLRDGTFASTLEYLGAGHPQPGVRVVEFGTEDRVPAQVTQQGDDRRGGLELGPSDLRMLVEVPSPGGELGSVPV